MPNHSPTSCVIPAENLTFNISGGGKREQQGQGTHLPGLGHTPVYWEIRSEVSSLPDSLNEPEPILLFLCEVASVLKKSVSICPPIAAPLCINIRTFLGTHT